MTDKAQNDLDLDINLAGNVQQLLFPKSSPVCNWCCIGIKNRMANGLGGDYYDFITMPDGCQTLFIGDVTGHGLSASVIMSLIYGFIHHATLEDCLPQKTAHHINRFLRTFARRSERFDHFFSTTLFFAIIEPKALEMVYLNCGQVPPLIRRDNRLFRLESTGPPLGYFDDPELHAAQFRFEKGDRILLYTDGIVEASNRTGKRFGEENLSEILLGSDHDHMEFLDELFESMADFGANDPPEDDCTAIVIDFHGNFLD